VNDQRLAGTAAQGFPPLLDVAAQIDDKSLDDRRERLPGSDQGLGDGATHPASALVSPMTPAAWVTLSLVAAELSAARDTARAISVLASLCWPTDEAMVVASASMSSEALAMASIAASASQVAA
jgi:hypothetical protein